MSLATVRVTSSQFWHQQQWVLPLLQPWTKLDDEILSNTHTHTQKERKRATKEEQNISSFFLTTAKIYIYMCVCVCVCVKRRFFFLLLCCQKSRREDAKREVLSLFPFWWCWKQGKRSWNSLFLYLFYFFPLLPLSISRPWIMGKW